MKGLVEYLNEAKSSTKLKEKIASVKKKLKEIDKSDSLTAFQSRQHWNDYLKAHVAAEKYLINQNKMFSTRSSSEYDKLEKKNEALKKVISDIMQVSAYEVIKPYKDEYED